MTSSTLILVAHNIKLALWQLHAGTKYRVFATLHAGKWRYIVSKVDGGSYEKIGEFEADNDASLPKAIALFEPAFNEAASKRKLVVSDLVVMFQQPKSGVGAEPCFKLSFTLTHKPTENNDTNNTN